MQLIRSKSENIYTITIFSKKLFIIKMFFSTRESGFDNPAGICSSKNPKSCSRCPRVKQQHFFSYAIFPWSVALDIKKTLAKKCRKKKLNKFVEIIKRPNKFTLISEKRFPRIVAGTGECKSDKCAGVFHQQVRIFFIQGRKVVESLFREIIIFDQTVALDTWNAVLTKLTKSVCVKVQKLTGQIPRTSKKEIGKEENIFSSECSHGHVECKFCKPVEKNSQITEKCWRSELKKSLFFL